MLSLNKIRESVNIADLLEKTKLAQIGSQVLKGYELDEDSRAEWKRTVDEAMKIAKQIVEEKNFPWDNASNIKYPLITRAGIDYASRTLPEIIQNERVVKGAVIGGDPENKKYDRATRVSNYMSYQLLVKSPDWEEGTDKLLQILPILGTVFKKTYYNTVEKRCVSELCVPDKIVVNYAAQSLETAPRITHLIKMSTNDIISNQRKGVYSKVEITLLTSNELTSNELEDLEDDDSPIELLEQHRWLDLDEDGYKEPYIVTVHKETGKVLRIVNRIKDVEYEDGKLIRILPKHYFTDYHFIRSPDGGYYSMGFGSLLLPINRAINSLINQLIDSGTLANTQYGFYTRNLRMKAGSMKMTMGRLDPIDAPPGTRLEDCIWQFPAKEPSGTLFQLLGLLMQVGQDLSSSTDVLMGKQPAQNVASSTVQQLVEQGTKVFTAINKRVYRALRKEYQKIYDLNYEYLSQDEYQNVLDDPAANVKADFEPDSLDILPVADPTISSESQRLVRAGVVQQLRTVDPREADTLLLQTMQFDKGLIEKILPPVDPNAPPPLEAQKMQAEIEKLQAEVAEIAARARLDAEKNQMNMHKLGIEKQRTDILETEAASRMWKSQQDALATNQKLSTTNEKMKIQEGTKMASTAHKMQMDEQDRELKAVELQIEATKVAKDDNKDKQE